MWGSLTFVAMLANLLNMSMKTKVSAADFQSNFGRYADVARDGPVVVTRYGRDELVVMSVAEYERLRASYRRVVVLSETGAVEAVELFEAMANAAPTPEAIALDHLMGEGKTRAKTKAGK